MVYLLFFRTSPLNCSVRISVIGWIESVPTARLREIGFAQDLKLAGMGRSSLVFG
jgi:hypothetical protein